VLGQLGGNINHAMAAAFSITEILPSGQRVEIRALRSTDREGMLTAVARSSSQSLYRRFFTVWRHFSEAATTFFLNLDFVDNVALGRGKKAPSHLSQAARAMSSSNLDEPRWPSRLSISFRARVSVVRSCGISHRLCKISRKGPLGGAAKQCLNSKSRRIVAP
jgi:hypothetical protein